MLTLTKVRHALCWSLLVAALCGLVSPGLPVHAGVVLPQAPAPNAVVNDDFDNALFVTSVPYSNSQDVIDAQEVDDSDPLLPCAYDQKKYQTVWYRYTPPTADTVVFSTDGSSYGTVLAVWTGERGSLTNEACTTGTKVAVALTAGITYHIEIARNAYEILPAPTSLDLIFSIWSADTLPSAFNKLAPADGAPYQSTRPILSWSESKYQDKYEYCYDTSDNDTCDTSWTTTNKTSADLTGLSLGTTYYWQVRAPNVAGETYADDGAWWSFATAGATDLNAWTGTVSGTTRAMSFDALTDGSQWLNFAVVVPYSGCGSTGTSTVRMGGPGPIANNSFGYNGATFDFAGTFTSRTTATGTYTLTNYPICVWITIPGYCCYVFTSGSGVWSASGPALTTVHTVYLPFVLRNLAP